MKKVKVLILLVVALLCMTACGTQSEEPTGQVADIFNSGYGVSFTVSGDNEINIMLVDDDNTSFIAITSSVSEKQIEEFDSLDDVDADYNDAVKEFLCGLDNVTIEELDSYIPTEDELDAFVGKTIADIEAEGYTNWGYSWEEGAYTLMYDNETIVMSFTIADPKGIENIDEASSEQIGALEISSAEFYNISDCFFDRAE